MSHILVRNWKGFKKLLQDDIFLSGNIFSVKKEIYNNMWIITFGEKFIKTIKVEDLEKFLLELLLNRSQQIKNKFNGMVATFYLWFDELAFQLRFNLLSGKDIILPFGCKLNILDSPLPIFKKFLNEGQGEIRPLSWECFKIFNPGDPGFDDEMVEDEPEWIVDVYVKILPI